MKRIVGFLMSRIVIVGTLILAQFGILFLVIAYFNDHFALYYSVTTVFAVILVCHIVSKRENPSYKIAWIILILLMPPFGAAIYMIFSGNHVTRGQKKRLAGMYSTLRFMINEKETTSDVDFDTASAKKQSDYITSTAYCPPFVGTECTYFPSGELFFPSFLESLEKAERFIFLEYFIIAKGIMWDSIHEILVRKANSGVDVRVIYDDMGCINHLSTGFNKVLEGEGISCRVFNRFIPVLSARLNNRNHRKICVVDGKVGFTGGINIADEYINKNSPYGYWKDNAVKLEGPAVSSLTAMFLSMWESLDISREKQDTDHFEFFPNVSCSDGRELGIIQPYTDNPLDDHPVSENVYINMISAAEKYVWITTPYLIIDYNVEQALCTAALSGVDVRIVVPGIPDKKMIYEATKSNYKALHEAGVKLYEYSPGFIHAKTFLCDDVYGSVGTVNLDFRSLYLHFECGVWIYKSPVLSDIKLDFEEMFNVSHLVKNGERNVGVFRRALRSVMDVMSPLI